jgi:hypothetical protein
MKKTPPKATPRKKPARAALREKINALDIIKALERHVLGKTEMTALQVSAALALLKKILPDVVDPARLKTAKKDKTKKKSHEDALDDLA